MKRDEINRNFEIFSVFLFSISIFIWKPGIYVSSGLIIAYMLIRAVMDMTYRSQLLGSKVMVVSVALYLFGLMTAAIGMQQPDDFLWMARKTLFLLVIGFFFITLGNERNRKVAFIGLMLGFWVATAKTLFVNWSELGNYRIEGTWPGGTWDTLLGLFFVFLVLILDNQKNGLLVKAFIGFSAVICLAMLFLAGGRGPMVAIVFGFLIYFIFLKINVRSLFYFLSILGVSLALSAVFLQERAEIITKTIASIVNVTEGSNWIRPKLWGIGFEHTKELATNEPSALLFGSGAKSFSDIHLEFFETLPYDEDDRRRLKEYGYPSGDIHNNYIDSSLRHGLLWTFAAFAYLVWLGTRFRASFVAKKPAPLVLVLYLMVVAMVYTIMPHFVTFFFVFFIAFLDQVSERQNVRKVAT